MITPAHAPARPEAVFAGAAFFVSAASAAPTLVAIDLSADELVRINTDTGAVVAIGALDRDPLNGADLASDGSSLFAVVTDSVAPEVWTIDPDTAKVLTFATIIADGTPASHAEAIAWDAPNQRLLAAVHTGQGRPTFSNQFVELQTDGSAAIVLDLFAVFGPTSDLDAMIRRDDGTILTSDGRPGDQEVDVHELDPARPAHSLLQTITWTSQFEQINDFARAPDGTVYALDNRTDHLHTIDPGTGALLGSIATPPERTLVGIAFVDIAACPGDLDGDNDVDTTDLNILLSGFGCIGGGCPGDIDGDGDTDTTDLNILLSAFGTTCM